MKHIIITLFVLSMSVAYAGEYSEIPGSAELSESPKAEVPFDLESLKPVWKKRLQAIKADGKLPIIDIESSFNTGEVDAIEYAKEMDENAIALTAFSPQIGNKQYKDNGALWHDGARRAIGADPSRYIPTSTAGVYPAFTENPLAFVEMTINKVQTENYPLMGEFEFRHYMSSRQYKRNQTERDVTVPLNSPAGEKLFQFAEKSGISFQIHYEIEDDLLPVLEEMLAKYPGAKVIWCHLSQVRYASRAKIYGPDYVRSLIQKYPNIYFDLAFGGADSVYPGSNEHHARVWKSTGTVRDDWVKLITEHPYRFLAALDIGGDRVDKVGKKSGNLRTFLGNLPANTQEIVAYKAAWRLFFNEDI